MDEIIPGWVPEPLSFEDDPDIWIEEDDLEDEEFDLEEDEELE